MKLLTFALAMKHAHQSPAPMNIISRIVEAVPPSAAHTVGLGSGVTGFALWAEFAKHLTTFAGLVVALLAMAGGLFYAIYWALKALREWREFRAK